MSASASCEPAIYRDRLERMDNNQLVAEYQRAAYGLMVAPRRSDIGRWERKMHVAQAELERRGVAIPTGGAR